MKITRKQIAFAGTLTAVAALVVLAVRPTSVPVDAATAAFTPLRETVDEEGMTRVRQRYRIASPIAGRLRRIVFDEGDSVRTGQILFHISPLPLDARAEAQARGRLDAVEALEREAAASAELAEATLDDANRRLARAESLAVRGLISPEELELAELEARLSQQRLDAARHRMEAAAFEVQVARAALLAAGPDGPASDQECVEIRAPIDGRVFRVFEENERVVSAGEPLIEIGDPTDLEVVVDLLSTDAVRVRPGGTMLIDDWGGHESLHAVVRLVEPSGFTKVSALGVEEQRVNVVADLVDPPAALGDGFRVETRTVLWESESVLTVPWSALVRRGEGWGVFVVDGARATWRDVEVGRRGAVEAEIRAGLEPDERVVVHPSDRVDDGVRVSVRREMPRPRMET